MTKLKLYLFLALTSVICNTYAEGKMQKILVMGDSLSAGYGIDPKQGWVNLLQNEFFKGKHWHLVNASVSGETTNGGTTRLPNLLTEHKPKIVIIELGANDGLRGQPLKIMQSNLQTMIDLSRKSGAKVLLIGMQIPTNYGQRYTREFKQIYSALSEKNDLVLVPFLLEGIATDKTFFQEDGLHPTAQAQPLIVKNVWPLLSTIVEHH
jgi:acyl-CoA thioesterase I